MNPRIALLAAGLLAGCATQERVEFVPTAQPQIRKIAILAIDGPRVRVEHYHPFAGGTLPGTIIQDTFNRKSSEAYDAEMNRRKKILAPELVEKLSSELGRKYEVVFVDQRPTRRDDRPAADNAPPPVKVYDYTSIKTDADAILSVFYIYGKPGYVSVGAEINYLPWVGLSVRLLDARTLKTLYYRQHLAYPEPENLRGSNPELIRIEKTRYAYATSERLVAEFDESYGGLLESQDAIVSRIMRDLGMPGQPVAEAKPSDPLPASTGR
jgi:hypothetical protein